MNEELKNIQVQSSLGKKLLNQSSLFPNVPVHPRFVPSTNNLSKNILEETPTLVDTNNNDDDDNNSDSSDSNNEPLTITTEDGVARYLSTSKMSSRGPVNKEFTSKGSTPSGKPRVFVCKICTRAFARQEHLKRHERSHTKEKPFTCNICSRKFSRRDLLLRHSQKLHAGAADVLPRLRKRSLKHMTKEEIENMKREEENNKRIKSNSISTISTNILSDVASGSSISATSSNNLRTEKPILPNSKIMQKIPEYISSSPSSSSAATTTTNNNSTPKSLLGRVLKSLTPSSLKNSSGSQSSTSSKQVSSSASISSNVSKSPGKRRLSTNTNNSLILEKNNATITSNHDSSNTLFANNENFSNISNNNNNNNNNNNIQLPLYPLNDNPINVNGDFSDINSSLATFDNLNENDTNFERLNDLQSNSYNYYRRASFSAMSGINYALTNPEPYASETVEFSTPQFISLEDEQERWLNSFSENDNLNELDSKQQQPPHQSSITEIQQLNELISKTQTQNQSHIINQQQHDGNGNNIESIHPILNGYSFYEDDALSITESLFKTRLGEYTPKKNNNPPPFKSNSPIMQNEILNSNFNHGKRNQSTSSSDPQLDPTENSKILQKLFEKISKQNSGVNMQSNVNVLDQLNLEHLEQMSNSRSNSVNNLHNQMKNGSNVDKKDLINNLFEQNNGENALEGVTKKVLSWQETLFNQPIADLEKLNEMHIAKAYGVPQGYSFYGGDEPGKVNRSNNNGILGNYNNGSLSSDATISPVLLDSSCSPDNNNQGDAMDVDAPNDNEPDTMLDGEHSHHHENCDCCNQHHHNYYQHSHHHKKLSFEDQFNATSLSSYSQAFLFTKNISRLVHHGLSTYPFFGTPTPELLSNDVLNLYVDQFIGKFLTHHPFIHKSVLNEHWLIKEQMELAMKNSISEIEAETYTGTEVKLIRDENFVENFKVSIVCMPLLVTTIGAVVSNKKEDAAILYEISRRCIHVYLESRKKLTTCGGNSDASDDSYESNNSVSSMNSSSPLWLIQSLTLSVIYGLFADEEISLSVIIRQVHALNALIKSSGLNDIKSPESVANNFKVFIGYESTIRTIHMIFHVSTLLSTLYNIVPSLNISDLNIDLPNASLLWECSSGDEYYKLVENFDFHAKNFKDVIKSLIKIDIANIDMKTGLINGKNFLLDNHVSEFGLICIQNGLHQLVYFKQLSIENNDGKINDNVNNISRYILEDFGDGIDISIEKIRKVGEVWDLLVKACILYNKSSEVYNDCKILNHYLNLKLSSIVSLNKVKENVWLKSFTDINEQYFACFNYSDNELKDQKYQEELIHLIDNSIDILKLVFFNEDNSLIGTISPSFLLENETMKKLDEIYATPPPVQLSNNDIEMDDKEKEELTNSYNYKSLNKINLNVLHKLSIDSQILFDVILIIVKFLTNYENFFKLRMRFNNLSNFTFLQHFEMSSAIFVNERNEANGEHAEGEEKLKQFDKVLFKYYLKFFKIFLNLEQFLKHNYSYEDFETGQALKALDNLYPNIKGSSGTNNNRNIGNEDFNLEDKDIDRMIRENHQKLREEERTLNDIVSDELVVFHDRDLIMSELINFKLPFKFLKMGGFLFGFIYDKNFKFVNFKHLSDVLFHLRIFLESKDEYV